MTIKDSGDISFHSNKITSGEWDATTIAVAHGGTGATTLNDLITLGTHTTGNYMNNVTQGTGVTVTHTAGEGSSAAIAIGQAVATTSNCQFAALGVGKANNTAGTIVATGDITAFAAASDISLKKDVTTIDNALDIVKGMRGVRFKWNDRAKELSPSAGDNVEVGVIAQEIGEILPEVVKDGVFEDTLAVKYEKITAVLIEAVKEQQSEIETLKEQVELLRRHL
jgi:trimeric autotransporter adhesin